MEEGKNKMDESSFRNTTVDNEEEEGNEEEENEENEENNSLYVTKKSDIELENINK